MVATKHFPDKPINLFWPASLAGWPLQLPNSGRQHVASVPIWRFSNCRAGGSRSSQDR